MVNMLLREGEDNQALEMLYREVVQEVLLVGSKSWVLSAAMEMIVDGTHTGFL